ncbi:hypothetical protein JCM10049v2_002696 [Rhodotorula toruloides]
MRSSRTRLGLSASTALVTLLLAVGVGAKDREITVTNTCTYTIWAGLLTSVGPKPSQPTGWEMPAGSTISFTVQETWGGRVWPRTGCDFSDSSKPDYAQCASGGCKGGLLCTESGVPPCTLAEFNLQENVDNYDLSLVDGYNVPIAITNSADCSLANCPYDLLSSCSSEQQLKDDKGKVVACKTDCAVHPENEQYCCSGAHSKPEQCPASGIPHYKWWKDSCPYSYVYAYDESSGTALFTCEKRVDYVITFCPDSSLYQTSTVVLQTKTVTQGSGQKTQAIQKVTTTLAAGGGGGNNASPTSTPSSGGGTQPAATGGGASSGPPAGTSGNAPSQTGAAGASSTGAGAGSGPSATSGGGAASPTDTGASGASPTDTTGGTTGGTGGSSGSSSGDTSSSDSSSSSNTIFGLSPTVAYSAGAVAALLVIGGFAFAVYSSKKHGHAAVKSDGSSASDSSSEDERGGSSRHKKKKKDDSSSSDSSDDDDDDRDRSLAKFSALEQAEKRAASESVYAQAARHPGGLAGLLGGESGRAGTATLFELPRGSDSSGSEAESLRAPSRRVLRQAYQ